ncbi:MAG: hypothetical protein AB4426_05080 [Xenococcaceae cyanobacterium]
MSKVNQDNRQLEQLKTDNSTQLPDTFEEAVIMVKNFVLLEIQKEAEQKQLYYHNWNHAQAVKRRAEIIFQAIVPFCEEAVESNTAPEHLTRMKHLIDICAIAHDLVQEFIPTTQPHTPRRREIGVSEAATISKLIDYIENLNKQLRHQKLNSPALFTNSDIQIIREAIEATICLYDPSDHSIYQRDLYNPDKKLSLPARIIALADIGSLGMEGIEVYLKEGALIFLEENLDIIPIILNREIQSFDSNFKKKPQDKQELFELLRQRLLKRARFQVAFAKGREARFLRELEGLSVEVISVLSSEVFKYLNKETIKKIEALTPTSDDTTLEKLLDFFELEKYIRAEQKI